MMSDTAPVESPHLEAPASQTPDLEVSAAVALPPDEPVPAPKAELVDAPGLNLNVPVARITDSEVVLGSWAGYTNYKCAYCDYATLDGAEAVHEHIAAQRGFGYAHHFPKN